MISIESLGDLRGKRVLVRSDLNVPLEHTDGGVHITDDGRIRASVPTIQRLADAGARVVVTAHLGRPKGSPDPQYSLAPVAERLGCSAELEQVHTILRRGASYQRQRAAARRNAGELDAVVRSLVAEMRAGKPL